MSTVQEIKQAIRKLPKSEQEKLVKWIIDWADDQWDRQMKDDLKSGKLDAVLSRARQDIRNGSAREFA